MSKADVEVVRRCFEAFNRRDFDRGMDAFDENAEWYPYLGSLDARVYRGPSEITAMLRDLVEHLEFRVEPLGFTDLGNGRVVVDIHAHGAGSGSGAEVEMRWAQLWTLKEGRVLQVDASADAQAAIKAAEAEE